MADLLEKHDQGAGDPDANLHVRLEVTVATARVCGWCGGDISQLKAEARYCSRQHKKNAASKRHRARNPGYYRRYHGSAARVAWLQKNREAIRAYARDQQRRYRLEHPEAARKWWATNAEKHRLYQSNRRFRLAAGPGVTERDWLRLVSRFAGRCAYCGCRPDRVHMDHVLPLKRGGQHSIGNVLPACRSCNTSKGSRLLVDWRRGRCLVLS